MGYARECMLVFVVSCVVMDLCLSMSVCGRLFICCGLLRVVDVEMLGCCVLLL